MHGIWYAEKKFTMRKLYGLDIRISFKGERSGEVKILYQNL